MKYLGFLIAVFLLTGCPSGEGGPGADAPAPVAKGDTGPAEVDVPPGEITYHGGGG